MLVGVSVRSSVTWFVVPEIVGYIITTSLHLALY